MPNTSWRGCITSYGFENFVGDLSSSFIFCQSVRIVQSVVCKVVSQDEHLGIERRNRSSRNERNIHIPTTASSAMIGNFPVLDQRIVDLRLIFQALDGGVEAGPKTTPQARIQWF